MFKMIWLCLKESDYPIQKKKKKGKVIKALMTRSELIQIERKRKVEEFQK